MQFIYFCRYYQLNKSQNNALPNRNKLIIDFSLKNSLPMCLCSSFEPKKNFYF
jgi:hypothetical protein